MAVGAAQYLSVIVNWSSTRDPATALLKHLAASYVSGWFLLGAAIGIGASGLLDPSRLLRSIVRVGYDSLVFAVPCYLLAFLLRQKSLFLISPVGHANLGIFRVPQLLSESFFYRQLERHLGGRLLPRSPLFRRGPLRWVRLASAWFL